MRWMYDLKLWLLDFTGLEKDALHVYVALGVFVFANLLFGWKAQDGKALLIVLIVAIANEVSDMRYSMLTEDTIFLQASIHDVVNTMALPTLLVALARWTPLFERADIKRGSSDQA